MRNEPEIRGVFCAVATPVNPGGSVNHATLADHCKALIEEGCDGLALLGTTGEANSFGLSERMEILEKAVQAGLDPSALLPGTGQANLTDAVALTRHAVEAGARAVLLLPPFYYKGVSEEGLFRFFAGVIEGVASDRLRIILYHIPQMSGVPVPHTVIARLLEDFPGIVTGIKDSSGDLSNMQAIARAFPGFSVLAGADPLMLPLLEAGGAGCITAACNLAAKDLRFVFDNWKRRDQADAAVAAAQERVVRWRELGNVYAQIPSVKAMLARRRGDQSWLAVRPPLVELSETERKDIWARMAELEER